MKKWIYTIGLACIPFMGFATSNLSSRLELGGDSTAKSTSFRTSRAEDFFQIKLANNRLNVELNGNPGQGTYALHDVLGNLIYQSNGNEPSEWSMSGLKSGIYFFVWKGNKSSFTKRIVFRQEN